jgi:hypothetical protein
LRRQKADAQWCRGGAKTKGKMKEYNVKVNWGIVGIFLFVLAIIEMWIACYIGYLLPDGIWPGMPWFFTSIIFIVTTIAMGIVLCLKEWD